MGYATILLEIEDGVALVKINRPEAMNSINQDVLLELIAAFQELDTDDAVRVIILSGEGKAFVAGADIKAMLPMSASEARQFSNTGHTLMGIMEKVEKPIIAAINGFALGGGMELAMGCDFIFASEKAKLGQPEINLGVIPGFGGSQRLSRLVGKARAKELIFTGAMIGAQEAKELGIVNKVFPPDELLPETKKVAAHIASKGALSLRLAKAAVDSGYDVDLANSCRIERDCFALCFSHQDQKEGMGAFLEKRPPKFTSK
jgi:enoyl-CoA hydratase